MIDYKLIEAELEQIIDKHGLAHVLLAIEQVCYEKAEHIRTNWQDRDLALRWERNGRRLGKVTREMWPLS
jgi:hypothetical protein